MTANQYKQICQRPNIFSRFIIEETARLLPHKRAELFAILKSSPIEKPALYQGPANADHFEVLLLTAEAREIAEDLLCIEAESNETHAAFIANFVDMWANLAEV